jgi:hypothetical protein
VPTGPPARPLQNPSAQDVAGLCDALRTNTALTELSCSCHPVPPPTAARFGAALAANAALRSVSIGDSSLGDAGLVAMADGLAANTGLTHLDCEHKVRVRAWGGVGWGGGWGGVRAWGRGLAGAWQRRRRRRGGR